MFFESEKGLYRAGQSPTFDKTGFLFHVSLVYNLNLRARIAVETVTTGKMRSIWASKSIPVKLKLGMYKTGVCSRLTYAWIRGMTSRHPYVQND